MQMVEHVPPVFSVRAVVVYIWVFLQSFDTHAAISKSPKCSKISKMEEMKVYCDLVKVIFSVVI